MTRKIYLPAAILLIFLVLQYLKYFYGNVIFDKESWEQMDSDLRASYINYTRLLVVLAATWFLFHESPFRLLGLESKLKAELLTAFLCILPMLIGYGYMAHFQTEVSLKLIHRDLVLAGFFEEFFFRGFLFGLLFYQCGFGFITAAVVPSIFFGLGHLYQADNAAESLNIFLFTALANLGFAWFYVAWGNLWFVIFLHGFMDLCWDMFSIHTNVTGDLNTNIFRFATLGLAIYFSVRKAMAINTYNLRGKFWVNKPASIT